MPVHHPPDASGIAGCCVVAPERGTPDAPRLFLAPNGYARRIPCVGDVQGLPVSLGSLLENLHIESLLGDHLLQPCVLFLQSLQLLGHLRLHATVLLSPAIIRLFGDFQQLAGLGHLLALTEFNIGFTKFGNDLIHCVTFLRHSESPFRAVRPSKILSLTMVQFYGGRSCLPLFPNEASLLRLVTAVLVELSDEWETGMRY